MRTSIDTSILMALWSDGLASPMIAKRLGEAKEEGALLVPGVVYIELLAYPKISETFLQEFFSKTGVVLDLRLEESVWMEAGRRFAAYAKRRRKAKEETPKRVLADFLVGAHALIQADRLMTLEQRRYKQDFPELRLFKAQEAAAAG